MRLTGLSRSTIYARIKQGAFPRQVKLGKNSRAVGWVASEVYEWIMNQIGNSTPDEPEDSDKPDEAQ